MVIFRSLFLLLICMIHFKRTIVRAMSSSTHVTSSLLVPAGMKSVHVGVPHVATTLSELQELGASRVFVLSNRSSRPLIEAEGGLIDKLRAENRLVAPVNCEVGMGGTEEGLLNACDAAAEAGTDCILTVGGGAIQDAGKFMRLWLSTDPKSRNAKATVQDIQAAQKQDPMPSLLPQICLPNSFAMAEATSVAGLTTKSKIKSGAAHASIIPTVVLYDPALSKGLPDWVRFGSALRGVEHAVGAVCHPKANDEIRTRALEGLRVLCSGLKRMVQDPESDEAQIDCYSANWMAIRALNTGCYPSIGHLMQNHYSARFNVHQGSCSGIICARLLHYHQEKSAEKQKLISEAMGDIDTDACRLVADLVATLPGVAREHSDVGVTDEMLHEFANFEYDGHIARLNQLCPKPFGSSQDILDMLKCPLDKL